MHIFADFVTIASAVLQGIPATNPPHLPHSEASALAVVWQTAIQEVVPLPHSTGQQARRLTDRTVLRLYQ